MKRHVMASILFVIGCATGGVASQLVVPAARAGTNPTRWEYFCTSPQGRLNEAFAKPGAEGWEMVSAVVSHYDKEAMGGSLNANAYVFCFKRALP